MKMDDHRYSMRSLSSLLFEYRSRQLRRKQYNRPLVLARAIRRLLRSRAPSKYSTLWTDAIYGWGNEKWSAEEHYLSEVVQVAEMAPGPILECGSGLTTLLIGAVASRRAIQLHSLEHTPEWHTRVSQAVRDFGLTNVIVHLAPLRAHELYDWYNVPLASLPNDFSYVVCDGPPESTRGGRSGVLPTMHGKLRSPCTVLLDDTSRSSERELIESWVREYHASYQIKASARGFARVVVFGA